jgi:hypothetical protein
MELERALAMCRASGWTVKVEYVAPPRGEPGGPYRVIRCLELPDNRFLLTAAREATGKGV